MLAPTAGRVITVPVTPGTVLMPGDTVATVAEQNFVLRLEVPERHARYIKVGDPIRLDGTDLGLDGPRFGTIKLVYPQIDNGHVVADATVDGPQRLFRRRTRARLGVGRRRASHCGPGESHRHPLGHRLCADCGSRAAKQSTCRCSAGETIQHPSSVTASKSFPDCNPATGCSSHEPGIFGTPDARDDSIAADAALSAGRHRLRHCGAGRPSRARKSRRSACRWSTSSSRPMA